MTQLLLSEAWFAVYRREEEAGGKPWERLFLRHFLAPDSDAAWEEAEQRAEDGEVVVTVGLDVPGRV